jgi:SAM-dependent methyltransferase
MTVITDIAARPGGDVLVEHLSATDRAWLADNAHRLGAVADIWSAMDAEWHRLGAHFGRGGEDAIAAFYRSPVWLLNGLFVETDPESRGHREAIAAFIPNLAPQMAVDFGGGFGSLARRIAATLPGARVALVDPYPHPLARHLADQHPNMEIATELPDRADLIVAEDVLEHVTDPVGLTARLAAHILPGGHLIAANCFKPVIACHYPGAFHLDLTFRHVVAPLGLRYLGRVPGAGHAQVFRRDGRPPDLLAARTREALSRRINPALDAARRVKRAVLGPRG